jgi:enolase
MKSAKIKDIIAREVLDSRGNPTVEADVITDSGLSRAIVPSGASVGVNEALELRDDDSSRYLGKGTSIAVNNVNDEITPELKGLSCLKQKNIDELMIKLDGTEHKSKLGANAMLAVSMAVCKAGALASKTELYKYVSKISGSKGKILPVPMTVILEGGKHADDSTDFQEFMIAPIGINDYKEALRCVSEIYQFLGKVLKSKGYNVNVGFEGAYGPKLGSNELAIEMIIKAIEKAGYEPGKDVGIAIDPASSEIYKNKMYMLKVENKELTSSELIDYFEDWIKKYPIISIEDGMDQFDWEGWIELTKRIGKKVQIVGDDLTVTNINNIEKAIKSKAINSLLVKVNQIGTVTESIDAVKMMRKAKLTSMVSHRSGETEDTFIADFVVGLGTGQCKFGAPCRSERTAKYNQLLRIEEELGDKAIYAGKDFRKIY